MSQAPSLSELRRQLQQLQELHAGGVLTQEQFEPHQQRLQQQIVERVMAGTDPAEAASPGTAHRTTEATPPVPPVSRRLLWMGAAFAVAVAIGGYAWTGSPTLWNQRAAAPAGAGADVAGASGAEGGGVQRQAAHDGDRADHGDGGQAEATAR